MVSTIQCPYCKGVMEKTSIHKGMGTSLMQLILLAIGIPFYLTPGFGLVILIVWVLFVCSLGKPLKAWKCKRCSCALPLVA